MLEESTAFQISYATPIVATFDDLPEAHGGTADVTFAIAFAPEPADLDADTLKANLTVTDGTLGTVSRETEGSNARWSVTVTPSPGDDLVIALAETTDCEAANAICTAAGGRLEESTEAGIDYAAPLTVKYTEGYEPPAEHDGKTAFKFRISFSDDLGSEFKVKKLRSAFEILQFNPTIRLTPRTKRHEKGKSQHWEVTVKPKSNLNKGRGSIRIAFEPADDCGSGTSVCTADGRRLTNALPLRLVQGPPSLSVADASVKEAEGATLDFTVRLSRAASETVTVDYETRDGSATAGSDYTAAVGTLTFAVGERTKTVSVAVLNDDVIDEVSETFKLKLSNASGGNVWIADGTAIGTIVNDDPMPQAWLAGFGQGELEMTHGHDGEAEERFRTDLGMRMGAVGARGEVLTPAEPGGLALAVRSDAFWVRTSSDAVRAREGVHGNLAAAEADASRLRLVVEGSRGITTGSGTLTPSLEVGLRHDGGDAETGTGVELGAALRYAGEGVSIEGAVRTLVAHEETGCEEWGARWAVAEGASVSLEGTRSESAGAEPGQALTLRGSLRW